MDPENYEDLYTNDAVLVDELFPHERDEVEGPWSYELQLPDTPCDNCTLQLVQMMTDKPPYVVGTNDLYFNCLDLVLTAAAGDVGADTGTEEDVGVSDVGAADVGDDSGDLDTGVSEDAGHDPDSRDADIAATDIGEGDGSTDDGSDAADSSGSTDSAPEDAGAQDQPTNSGGSGCSSAQARSASALGLLVGLLSFRPMRRRRRIG